MTKIDVAVIPAAGRGTRMRPATRVVPKALLPVVDRPAIQYAVEEAVRAGASEAVLVVDVGVGGQVYRHFTEEEPLPGLEHVKIRIAVQEEPHGLGHAVWTAKEKVGDRPFFCLLADDIVRPGSDVLPGMAAGLAKGGSMLCLYEAPESHLDSKGIVRPGDQISERVISVAGAVEKPGKENAPSRLGMAGRYLFNPEVFGILESLPPGYGGEIQLTDAINEIAAQGRMNGYVSESDLLDVGNPGGLMRATTELGLAGPHADGFRSFLRRISEG